MIIGLSGKISSGKDTVGQMIQLLDAGYTDKEPLIAIQENDIIEGQSNWQIKKFADKVKDIICLLIGCTREQLEDREFKEKPLGDPWECWVYQRSNNSDPVFTMDEEEARMEGHWKWGRRGLTPRSMMQLIGTEAGREIIHPNIWINALFADYKPIAYKNADDSRMFHDDFSITLKEVKSVYPSWIITDTRFPNEVKAIKDRNGILIRINRIYSDPFHNMIGTDLSTWKAPSAHPSETSLDNYKDWDYVIDNNGSLEDLLEKVKEIYHELKN